MDWWNWRGNSITSLKLHMPVHGGNVCSIVSLKSCNFNRRGFCVTQHVVKFRSRS